MNFLAWIIFSVSNCIVRCVCLFLVETEEPVTCEIFCGLFLFRGKINFLFGFLRMILLCLCVGMVESDPEGALAGFAQVVQMEQEKAEW